MAELEPETDIPETQVPQAETKPEIKPEQKPEAPAPQNPFYKPDKAYTNIEDFWSQELSTPRQEFKPSPEPEPKQEPGQPSQKKEPEPEDTGRRAEKMGKLFFMMFDKPLIMGASLISGADKDAFKIPESDKKELIEAWAEIADAYDWKKPPAWLVIVIFMSVVYGNIYWEAFRIRNAKRKKAQTSVRAKAEQIYNEHSNQVPTETEIISPVSNPQPAKQQPIIEDVEIESAHRFKPEDFIADKPKGGRPSKETEKLQKIYRTMLKEHPELIEK
jgi:hypothetical protein